jgi:hypothetical protein
MLPPFVIIFLLIFRDERSTRGFSGIFTGVLDLAEVSINLILSPLDLLLLKIKYLSLHLDLVGALKSLSSLLWTLKIKVYIYFFVLLSGDPPLSTAVAYFKNSILLKHSLYLTFYQLNYYLFCRAN